MRIGFHKELCTACGACAVACMDLNDIEKGQAPYRRVTMRELADGGRAYLSESCLHCSDARCAAVCPGGCLWYDEESGLTRWDNAECVGCGRCADACPQSAISFRPDDSSPGGARMEKCHGCLGLIEAGRLPACVRACPSGALSIE